MLGLKIRLIGCILAGVYVTWLWVRHKKKHTPLIKYKPTSEVQRIKRVKIEKKLDIACVVGLLIFWLLVGVPSALDLPYLFTDNLQLISGEVTGGDMIVENKKRERQISVKDVRSGEEVSLYYYGTGTARYSVVTARVLPYSKWGYIIEMEGEN